MPIILIAEDDDFSYFYIEKLLRKDNKTLRACNGQEAVDLCKKHPDINLVLMDIKMPVMNGIEATLIIKSFRNDLPIIALTAFTQSGDKFKIKEAGCDDYLSNLKDVPGNPMWEKPFFISLSISPTSITMNCMKNILLAQNTESYLMALSHRSWILSLTK